MSEEQPQPNRKKGGRRFGKAITTVICVAVLAGAGAAMWIIFNTEPKATRGDSVKKTAMLVETVPAEQGTFEPEIVAMGTVRPAQEVMLSPRVSGMIVEKAESFNPGGFVKEGEVLLKIDPADFENVLRQRESDLRQANADLEIEMGRQNVARQGAELLTEQLDEESEALVMRQPQLNTARANVEAARANVEQAKLDLARTEIKAPFDAHVLSREVSVGSQVSATTALGQLVGIEEYWIEATVPLSVINRLSFSTAGPNTEGSEVEIFNPSSWENGTQRTGILFQLVGSLAEQTRLARVLVSVKNPLSRMNPDEPPLIIGSFVETHLKTKAIPDVIRLERGNLHQNNTVWVMTDGKLEIRNVRVAFSDARYAYIEDGLKAGELVVTSNLSTVADGIELRTEGTSETPPPATDGNEVVKD